MSEILYDIAHDRELDEEPANIDKAAAMLKDLWETQDKILETRRLQVFEPRTREVAHDLDWLYWQDHERALLENLCHLAAKTPGVVDVGRGLHKLFRADQGSTGEDYDEPTFDVEAKDFFTERLYERDLLISAWKMVVPRMRPEAAKYFSQTFLNPEL